MEELTQWFKRKFRFKRKLKVMLRFNNPSQADSYNKSTRLWLGSLIILVLIMISIGGATRLTGSGLSITEWKPIAGMIPPLSAETWNAEFERYKQIPQYKLQNAGISLEEFKPLFWWEWGHRQLGRFIGLVYIIGFVGLMVVGAIRGRKTVIFTGIGLLLGLQGLAGWIMVHSGLQEGMVAVAPIRLAVHLTLAFLFLGSLVWMFAGYVEMVALPSPLEGEGDLGDRQGRMRGAYHNISYPSSVATRHLLPQGEKGRTHPTKTLTLLCILILWQVILGALVAGNKAGLVYNTWPLIDGAFIPPASGLFFEQPWWRNFFDNHLMVQFNHRIGAYILLIVALWHAWQAWRIAPRTKFARNAIHLAGLITLQAGVGIMTLLMHVPLWAGLLHQSMAAFIFAYAVWCAYNAKASLQTG
jgi:heme a synthase